jgi:hypothetical protein
MVVVVRPLPLEHKSVSNTRPSLEHKSVGSDQTRPLAPPVQIPQVPHVQSEAHTSAKRAGAAVMPPVREHTDLCGPHVHVHEAAGTGGLSGGGGREEQGALEEAGGGWGQGAGREGDRGGVDRGVDRSVIPCVGESGVGGGGGKSVREGVSVEEELQSCLTMALHVEVTHTQTHTHTYTACGGEACPTS